MDMDSVRALAEKTRKKLNQHPELQERILNSFLRLIRFMNLSKEQGERLLVLSGFEVSGYEQLSLVKDAEIYDILDTYELGKRFQLMQGSWPKTWNSIKDEVCSPDPTYGSVTQATLNWLQKAFNEVVEAAGTNVNPNQLFFENFARVSDGRLLMLT
jgi:hypothetical protein